MLMSNSLYQFLFITAISSKLQARASEVHQKDSFEARTFPTFIPVQPTVVLLLQLSVSAD